MNIKQNIFRVFSVNFLSMLSSIIVSFIVPSVLSVENYGYLKEYTFYISYITLFSLGYVDGIYIKYGGREETEINKKNLKKELNFFWILQIFFTILILIVSSLYKNVFLFLMALTIIPVNVTGFYKLYYQAIGDFVNYSKINSIYIILYFILNIVLVFIIKEENFLPYCLITLITNTIVLIIYEYKFRKNYKNIKNKIDFRDFKHIKIGFFILIGNLSVMLFYAIDRWFIKLFFDTTDFAYYSFAISMLNVVNLLINAISITFYNYLSKNADESKIKVIKRYLIILGGFASFAYFGFSAVITLFLNKYYPALGIISISFASYPYMIIINALYVNLYKARKDEKKYVKVVFCMLVISIVFNFIAIIIAKRPESIAMATTLSFFTWFIFSMKDFEFLKTDYKELAYLLSLLILFLICAFQYDWFIGGIIYLIGYCILTNFNYKTDLMKLFSNIVKNRE